MREESSRPLRRPVFESEAEFERRSRDAEWWRPYVLRACLLHRLEVGDLRTATSGANPAFLVGERHVVKFFSPYGEGARTHAVERDVGDLLRGSLLPVPRLEAQGELFPDGREWPWPYLVNRALPGSPLRDVADRLEHGALMGVARFAGRILRRLHDTPPASPVLRHSADEFPEFLRRRALVCGEEHLRHGALPPHLARQLPSFLPPPSELLTSGGLRLLHGSLDRRHLLVEEQGSMWTPVGLVGFGEARLGDPLYDLGPLHLGLFGGDKRLLAEFLRAYEAGAELTRDFARRATALALMHPAGGLGPLFEEFPALALTGSLEALARRLFDLDAPGLRGERAS